jgi:hypothetical protein
MRPIVYLLIGDYDYPIGAYLTELLAKRALEALGGEYEVTIYAVELDGKPDFDPEAIT